MVCPEASKTNLTALEMGSSRGKAGCTGAWRACICSRGTRPGPETLSIAHKRRDVRARPGAERWRTDARPCTGLQRRNLAEPRRPSPHGRARAETYLRVLQRALGT